MAPLNTQGSHAPLASLAAHWNACKGDIPPPLVGASITLVDNADPSKAKIYLFGGRLVTTRRMVNDMYELNLLSLHWTKLSGDTAVEVDEQDANATRHSSSSYSALQPLPQARYFHSSNLWDGKLVIFGGMGYVDGSDTDLGVLDEVVIFDLATKTWDLSFDTTSASSAQASLMPQARYAHLSSTTADTLVIIGGQDMANRYVEEINMLDLKTQKWTVKQAYEKQRGSYRSLAIEPLSEVEDYDAEPQPATSSTIPSNASSGDSQANTHPLLSSKNIRMLPVSAHPVDENGRSVPLPIYIYTNYNFTDVRREMEVIKLRHARSGQHEEADVAIEDKSTAMSGSSLPPGLRFPTGAVLGNHLLISGTYLANTSQTFALWALHLPSMTWNRLDVGPLLSTGSWNRGILWHSQNRMIIFGHRERELVADYNHRQTNWNHVLMIELEAWGITQPTEKKVSLASIHLGLSKLASSTVGSFSASLPVELAKHDDDPILTFGGRGDFEIICSDGMRLGCDRIVLERRWPWFASKMRDYQRKVKSLTKNGSPTKRSSRPGTGEQLSALMEVDERSIAKGQLKVASLSTQVDPRITPRQLHMTEPSPVVLALLIFIYTRCVCTQLQRHPAIVAALLIVSKMYDMEDLEAWTKHTAHVIMSNDLAPPSTAHISVATPDTSTTVRPTNVSTSSNLPILERHRLAVALYEAATMSGFEALQIRALRTVMSIAKYVQRTNTSTPKVNLGGGGSNEFSASDLNPAQISPTGMVQVSDRHNSFSGSLLSPAVVSPTYPSSSSMMNRNDSMHGRLSAATDDSNTAAGAAASRRRSSRASVLAGHAEGSGADGITPNPSTFTSLSRSSTRSNGATATSQRRPSAPQLTASNSNDGVSARTATTTTSATTSSNSAVPATSVRKRFSIFGRSNNEQTSKPSNTALLNTSIAEASVINDRHGKSNADQQGGSSARLHRTNTQGSTGATSMTARSTSSLNATAAAALGSPNESVSTSTSSLPRLSEFGASSTTPETGTNTGRKMSTTLNRFKSTGRPSTANAGNNANEEAIAGATVITAPTRMSVSASEDGPPRSPHSQDHKGKRGAGQLDKKNVVALNGIFA